MADGGYRRYPGPEALYEYDLFAVINHDGQIDNGHYTSFARFQDEVRQFSFHSASPGSSPLRSGTGSTTTSMSFVARLMFES